LVLFLHPGLADSRIWDPQWMSYAARYRLVRCDLPGFGRTPLAGGTITPGRDVVALLDRLGVTAAAIVGCSLGGRIALELATARPDLVSALVLVGTGLPGFAWSQNVRDGRAAEELAVLRGDLDAATEINVRMWVDGPNRTPSEVDLDIRTAVALMQHEALELQAPYWDDVKEEPLVPDLSTRLNEVQAPTLVLYGEKDVEDIHRLANTLATAIPSATLASIPGAAHVPNFEQPTAFDSLVLDFLAAASLG
jgi:3-oxoadipate enol-lactonase